MSRTKTDSQPPERFSGDWETKRLGEITKIRKGTSITEKNVVPGTIPVIAGGQKPAYFHNSANRTGKTITVSASGAYAGYVALHNQPIFASDCSTISENPSFSIDYLYYYLVFKQNIIYNAQAGGAQPHVHATDLMPLQVHLPPLREQRAIAEVLSDVDALLTALEALIAKKRDIKKATMQQLLTGKTRLPGFTRPWKTKRLGEIALFFKGSGLSKADLSLDGKRRCIHYGELFTTYSEIITEVRHGTDRDGTFSLSRPNDVLMPGSAETPDGLATASCIFIRDVILGGDVLVIRVPADIVNGVFLAYAVKINRDQVMRLVSGTTVHHLYGRDMAHFSFVVPGVLEQRAIADVLSDMDAEIGALEKRLEKTRSIKHGMMQELLTGRVRLPKSEPTLSEIERHSTEMEIT